MYQRGQYLSEVKCWALHPELTPWWSFLFADGAHHKKPHSPTHPISYVKVSEFQLKFHLSLFTRVQSTVNKHWFTEWLGVVQVIGHYLNQWWPNSYTRDPDSMSQLICCGLMSPYDISGIDQHCFVFVNGVWEGTLLFYNKNKHSTSVARATPVSAGFKHKISSTCTTEIQWALSTIPQNAVSDVILWDSMETLISNWSPKANLSCCDDTVSSIDEETDKLQSLGGGTKRVMALVIVKWLIYEKQDVSQSSKKNKLFSPHTFLSHITEPQSCLLYDIAIFIFTAHLGSWIIGKLIAAPSLFLLPDGPQWTAARNKLSCGQAKFPRILNQNGQNDLEGHDQWPPFSIPVESIPWCMFGANLVIMQTSYQGWGTRTRYSYSQYSSTEFLVLVLVSSKVIVLVLVDKYSGTRTSTGTSTDII